MEQKKKQNHKLYGGFQYAFTGIVTGVKQEQNMKMHAVVTVLVVIAGFFFHISMTEWCICLLLCGLIMALELVNTAVEAVVDLVTEERKPLAKIAKDTAAGAVFILAIFSAVIGCIIFLPKVIAWI